MKKLKYFLFVCLLGCCIASCNKEDDDMVNSTKTDNNILNFRIKTLTGHSLDLGNYKFNYVYKQGKLDTINGVNDKDELVTQISFNRTSEYTSLYFKRRQIYSYEKEDKQVLDTAFVKYCSVVHFYDKSNLLTKETIDYFDKIENFNEAYPKYEKKSTILFLYEYDDKNRLCKIRTPNYTEKNFPAKSLLRYEGNKLSEVVYYRQNGIDWEENYKQQFSYSGDVLSCVKGFKKQKEDLAINYSNDKITLSKDIKELSFLVALNYTRDNDGNITNITYANGDNQIITYEKAPTDRVTFQSLNNSYLQIPNLFGPLRYKSYYNYMFEK